MLEDELSDRASQDERRLQRIAAAEQLRAADRRRERGARTLRGRVRDVARPPPSPPSSAAEASVERATAALSDAVRRLRRIAEALPPALRPRAGDDPLGELPRLRETLAAEVERAEVALAAATEDLERARGATSTRPRSELDDHLTVVPTDDVGADDLRQALLDLVGTGDVPAVLDDPLVESRRRARRSCSTSSSPRPSGAPSCCSPTTPTRWGGRSACPTTSAP